MHIEDLYALVSIACGMQPDATRHAGKRAEWRTRLKGLRNAGYLAVVTADGDPDTDDEDSLPERYALTEKGSVFVAGLRTVPEPIATWRMPVPGEGLRQGEKSVAPPPAREGKSALSSDTTIIALINAPCLTVKLEDLPAAVRDRSRAVYRVTPDGVVALKRADGDARGLPESTAVALRVIANG